MKTQLLCRPLTSTAFFKSVFSSDNLLASFISCNKLPNFIACLATRSPDSRHTTTKFGDFVAKVDLVLLCQVKVLYGSKRKKNFSPRGVSYVKDPLLSFPPAKECSKCAVELVLKRKICRCIHGGRKIKKEVVIACLDAVF